MAGRTRLILGILPLLCGMALAARSGLATQTGRIDGQIVLSPATPVSRLGDPNQRPIAGQVAVIDERGAPAAHVASDQQGNFHIKLPPGRYTLHVESSGRMGHSPSVRAVVTAGRVTKIVVTVDIGIR